MSRPSRALLGACQSILTTGNSDTDLGGSRPYWYDRLKLVLGFVAVLWGVFGGNHSALAHWADLSVAEIAVFDTHAIVSTTFPTGLLEVADTNHSGILEDGEVAFGRLALMAQLGRNIEITAGGKVAKLVDIRAEILGLRGTVGTDRHSTIRLEFRWEKPTQDVKVRYAFFLDGVDSARCLATLSHGQRVETYAFTPRHDLFDFAPGKEWREFGSFVAFGIEHIAIGVDHILFLICLLLLGGGFGYLFKVVTAFTVAHSITLTLATMGLVQTSPRIVESAIALTIVYVALENLWRRNLRGRWAITLLFGLVHGFGFAGVLSEMEVPKESLVRSLVGFNLGVEIGQIVIVSAAYVALLGLERMPWDAAFRRLASAGVAAIGIYWFVERAFFPA